MNSFVNKLTQATPPVGTLLTFDAPEVAEILSLCGFDWLFIDMEHGAFTIEGAQHTIQAVRGDCSALVRAPENSPVWIKRVMDIGPDGIIVPQVNSADEARRAVAAAKYPPLGARSVGIGRAHGYGLSFGEYVTTANEQVALIIQIEHIQAVDQLDEILQVKGIDGILIGPYDLSGSMNQLGQVKSDPVQKEIRRIKDKCIRASVPYGIFVVNPEEAPKEIEDGCHFLAVGTDSSFLISSAKNALSLTHLRHPANQS
jgi:2-keto-3-deoxy-L-rhamnonate aldolase RhmA